MDADAIMQVINEIGAKISGPAAEVWRIFVRQSMACGVVELIVAFVCAALAIACFIYVLKSGNGSDDIEADVGGVFLLGILLTIISVVLIATGVLRVINPEYYAIINLMESIKS
jgi:heme/copper-type cytochrome/quinol oxidase subunit 2